MNSTVKKLMSLMLAGGLILSVAACGSGGSGLIGGKHGVVCRGE